MEMHHIFAHPRELKSFTIPFSIIGSLINSRRWIQFVDIFVNLL